MPANFSEWMLAIQTMLLFTSFVAAVVAVVSNSGQAKKNRTITELDAIRTNTLFRESIKILNEGKAGKYPSPIEALQAIRKKERTEDHAKVYNAAVVVLGRFEIMASGIREGVFDEQTIKRAYYTTIVEVGGGNSDFIEAYRKYAQEKKQVADRSNNTAYMEIKWLLDRWRDSPLSDRKHKIFGFSISS